MDQQEEGEVVVVQEQEQELRYLGFVHVAAVQAVVCLAGLYGLAKDHAGPLRPCVDATEHAVKGVVGPVYRKVPSRDSPCSLVHAARVVVGR